MASVGFINHAKLAFHRNASTHNPALRQERQAVTKNPCEKAGDAMLLQITHLPGIIKKLSYDPRVQTLAFTGLAMASVQAMFYPSATSSIVQTAYSKLLKNVSLETLRSSSKVSAYILSMLTVVGTGTRAMGRFTNSQLMEHFYMCHGFKLNDKGELERTGRR